MKGSGQVRLLPPGLVGLKLRQYGLPARKAFGCVRALVVLRYHWDAWGMSTHGCFDAVKM
jgi:hypothetical protein